MKVCFYLHKISFLLLFISCCTLFASSTQIFEPTQQPEEGWRWKKTFVLKNRTSENSVDHIHDELNKIVFKIKETLKSLHEDPNALFALLRRAIRDNPKAYGMFLSLESDGRSVGDIFKTIDKTSGEVLEKFWTMRSETDDANAIAENKDIKNIIRDNISRMQYRNFVVATFGFPITTGYRKIPITIPDSHKLCVFVSGTGNNLLKILELHESIDSYHFVTFDDKNPDGKYTYRGFLIGNLGYIFSHDLVKNSRTLADKSSGYKNTIDTVASSMRALEKEQNEYAQLIQELQHAVQQCQPLSLDDATRRGEEVRKHAESLRSAHSNLAALNHKNYEINAKNQQIQLLVSDFYHSEQLLRLFLYTHIMDILPDKELHQIGDYISQHVHSLNDVCERCSHCLFIEESMRHADINTRPPTKAKVTRNPDPYGFFEKINNKVKESGLSIEYLILVSSNQVSEKRGEMHRYRCGHGSNPEEPIDTTTFPPLVAFRCLSDGVHFSSLPIPLGDTRPPLALQQSYYPNPHSPPSH